MVEFLEIIQKLNSLGGIAYVVAGVGGWVTLTLGKRWLAQNALQHAARLKSDAAMQSEVRNLSDLILALLTREVGNKDLAMALVASVQKRIESANAASQAQ